MSAPLELPTPRKRPRRGERALKLARNPTARELALWLLVMACHFGYPVGPILRAVVGLPDGPPSMHAHELSAASADLQPTKETTP